jgi:hypothetical protein
MTKDQVKEILNRVLTWAPERQADAAEVIQLMEAQDKSTFRLTDEQALEVPRRISSTHREFVTLEQARARFSRPDK